MVADKPGVRSGLIDRAIAEFKRKSPAILYVKTPAGRGHPIIFSRNLFAELLLLEGDRIGNELVAKHAANAIELPDEAVQIDIDTEEDYRRLIEQMNQSE
jgi:molybdenum cofactor cytidylyltransferase